VKSRITDSDLKVDNIMLTSDKLGQGFNIKIKVLITTKFFTQNNCCLENMKIKKITLKLASNK
jgi:hypothetical protein